MATSSNSVRVHVSVSFPLLGALLLTLLIAGGASRGDVLGQVLVRGVAWLALVGALLFGPSPNLRGPKPVLLLLLAALGLALLQLVPLPPRIWLGLPGRDLFAPAAALIGQEQPWRPLAIVPSGAANAAGSLVVPFAILVLVTTLSERERAWMPGVLLGMILASTLVGLLQFSGVGLNNPLINDPATQVGGTFANRNHFALFLAFGCLLAPVWPFLGGRRSGWRGPVALGLALLLALTIVAAGSRAGLVLGALALLIGLVIAGNSVRREMRRAPRWSFPALVATVIAAVGMAILVSITAGRAVAIDRLLVLDAGQDMRGRALPTVIAMLREYFPFGSGLGGFDPTFRLHEPFELLKPTYFNHAHNDLLEVVLEAGLPGLLVLASALIWWAWASVRAWRRAGGILPKLGSAILLLVIVASAFDYPARTPMIMSMMVIAGIWLSDRADERGASALRHDA